jgi:hypothetical protein
MNTTAQNTLKPATPTRLSALALASVMTVAMLLAVNGLATSEPSAAQLAQHGVAAAKA